jgi:phage gp29-like protein
MASPQENAQNADVEREEVLEMQPDANAPQLSAPVLQQLRTTSKQRHTRQLNKMYRHMENRESKTELKVHRGIIAELLRDCEVAHQNYKTVSV